MPLDLGSLRNAIAALESVQGKAEDGALMSALDDVTRNAIRSGVIQHFEFTYELCWKFIRRWLEVNNGPVTVDGVTRRELFRMGVENRLIEDFATWMRYHNARNETSHTYNPATADRVYETSLDFVRDAKQLLAALEARND